jgi:hypothetical protein
MRGARHISLLLLLVSLAALAAACGSSSGSSSSSTGGGAAGLLQARLRALAAGAPAGRHAYWLGPQFRTAPVAFVNPGWGRFAILSYHAFDRAPGTGGVDLDVATFTARPLALPGGHRVVTRTPSGQQVVLVFRSPAHPSAALVRAAKAALQPIPPDVRYPA